jgi:GGDEF domain-containing protein
MVMLGLSLGEKLRNWFADEELTVTAPAPRSEVANDADVERMRGLERRLNALLAQPQLLSAGRIHMLNLDSLRAKLGSAWDDLRDRVHNSADRIINRHIADKDVQFRSSDGEYIIVFAALDRSAAALVCAKIAEELYRLFLGDPTLADITVSTAVGVVDGKLLFEHASVADLLSAVEQTVRAGSSAEQSAGPTAAPTASTVANAEEPRKLKLSSLEMAQIGTMYRPLWDVGRQVISTYMCTPVRRFPDGTSVEGMLALSAISEPPQLVKVDIDTLADTIEILDELFRNKFRLMVSVPVCFETLAARRSRQDYLAICQSIPDYLRPFLIFEFLRFPAGVPGGRMSELVNEVRPFCRWTFLRVECRQQSFASLSGTGLTGLTTMIASDRGTEARIMEDMNSFVAAAERASLKTCIVGITSTSLAVAARAAGATLIAGDRIGRAGEIPQHMLRFGWQDLFLREAVR